MRQLFRSLVVLSALALPAAAFADTFTGQAVFSDLGPNNNPVSYAGVFTNPSFSFSGITNDTFADFLKITLSNVSGNNGDMSGTDNLSVVLTFTAPDSKNGTISGSGTVSGQANEADGTITWSDATITFSDGSQLLAHIPTFSFDNADLKKQDGGVVVGGNMVLTVVTDGSKTTTTPAVPEPSSIALMGTGLLTAANLVRKRLKA